MQPMGVRACIGVYNHTFATYGLDKFWRVLATNQDEMGTHFVSLAGE